MIPGSDEPLHLHRACLGTRSKTIESMLKGETNSYATFNSSTQCVTWVHDNPTMNETYHTVLVKWLRFCYGEDQTFRADECPIALNLLSQLQLINKEKNETDIRTMMENHMVATAREDAEAGAEMLSVCLRELRRNDRESLVMDAERELNEMLEGDNRTKETDSEDTARLLPETSAGQ